MSAATTAQAVATATIVADEFAALLRVHRRTFDKMRRSGKIPAPLIEGRCPRWSRAVVEAWIEGRTIRE